MKFHKYNFYRNTYCEFEMKEVDFFKEMKAHFQSKSGSYYYYKDNGVYRYSNHWGRVATCRWKIKGIEQYRSQNYYVGFSKWSNFYPLNSTDKVFYLEVDYIKRKAKIKRITHENDTDVFLMNSDLALKRLRQIQKLFKEKKWAVHYELSIDKLLELVIKELITSRKDLQQIKKEVCY